jgi:AcrR family transcriptional regulator
MVRVTKSPDERREELIEIAEKLFIKYGYEETPVSDIVKKARVAQGTFYYYFKSKDEILDAIVDKLLVEVKENVVRIQSMKDLDAIEKMIAMSNFFKTLGKGREKLVEYLHEERNAHLHLKLEKKIYPKLVPAYENIILQGIDEKLFDTKFPKEAAATILALSQVIFEGKHDHTEKTVVNKEKVAALLDITERILGAKPGIFMKYASKKEAKK